MTPSNQLVRERANSLIDAIQHMAGMTSEAQSLEDLKTYQVGIWSMFDSLCEALTIDLQNRSDLQGFVGSQNGSNDPRAASAANG